MIRKISEIMIKNFVAVDTCDGVLKAERMLTENNAEGALVFEGTTLVGVVTYKDLLRSHPNRIVADAMNTKIFYISLEASLWKAEEMFKKHHTEILIVKENATPVGFITKAILYAELGKYIDPLTGLNRSDYIYYKADEIMKNKREIGIIFIDVNNFGYIDKNYGHTIGDVILKEIGSILKNNIPNDTYTCRFGGDEFVVVAPYDLNECKNLAQNLRKTIESYHFINNVPVSITTGIAGWKVGKNVNHNFRNIINIMNAASLASTKAKKEEDGLSVAESFEIIDIA
ncbi:diguanylate cyclase [Crassaminicella thermophila]|uniref:Diguanylate cyclase n=1 Tax=Crassaminicella thermophila TaxID=2599308 RepID=A0A5C0SCS2_CRATE|nr:GGDEF domain-containing protein [Crassaminicella thermophila]QEK11248.1 diguanylate cyclase [Crassaminicella thermophila]